MKKFIVTKKITLLIHAIKIQQGLVLNMYFKILSPNPATVTGVCCVLAFEMLLKYHFHSLYFVWSSLFISTCHIFHIY